MCYEVLVRISPGYPSVTGRLHTRYSPVRRSPSVSASWYHVAPRLACVRPVASVHPEPGSNSSLYIFFLCLLYFQRFAPELKTLTYCSCLDVDFFYFPFSRQGVKPVEKTSRTTLSIVIISMNFYCYLRVFSLKGNLRRENGAKIISFAGFFQIFWPLFSPVINFFPQKRRQR